jgi:hypothetical protein
VLLDTDRKVFAQYKSQYIPLNILVNMQGKIIYRDNPIPSEEVIKKALADK